MSFWNKNKLPAEYKDLSEDQITELLNKGKTAEAEALTAKQTADTEKIAREKAEKEAKDLREALKARPAAEPATPQNQPTEPAGPPDVTDWLTNPNDAFNRASAPTTMIALHGAIMSARLLADQFIRQQGPLEARLWNKYQAEVQAIVDKMNPQERIIPQTWINQFVFVKGLHVNDIVKEGQKEGDTFFAETAGSTGAGINSSGNGTPKDDVLTDQEIKIAARMGVKPEDYLKRKKAMTYGGPGLVGGV